MLPGWPLRFPVGSSWGLFLLCGAVLLWRPRYKVPAIGEGVEQELIEGVICHVVVLDLPGRAFIVHIVRRVRDHEVGLDVVHQSVVGFLLCGISADQTVPTERPDVASLGKGGLFQLLIHIEIIVMHAVLQAVLEKVVDLGRVKTGEGNIKVLTLQVSDQQGQLAACIRRSEYLRTCCRYRCQAHGRAYSRRWIFRYGLHRRQ